MVIFLQVLALVWVVSFFVAILMFGLDERAHRRRTRAESPAENVRIPMPPAVVGAAAARETSSARSRAVRSTPQHV